MNEKRDVFLCHASEDKRPCSDLSLPLLGSLELLVGMTRLKSVGETAFLARSMRASESRNSS